MCLLSKRIPAALTGGKSILNAGAPLYSRPSTLFMQLCSPSALGFVACCRDDLMKLLSVACETEYSCVQGY